MSTQPGLTLQMDAGHLAAIRLETYDAVRAQWAGLAAPELAKIPAASRRDDPQALQTSS
jgi:hypothetical protein